MDTHSIHMPNDAGASSPLAVAMTSPRVLVSRAVDHIVLLVDGRVAQQGSFADMYASCNVFKQEYDKAAHAHAGVEAHMSAVATHSHSESHGDSFVPDEEATIYPHTSTNSTEMGNYAVNGNIVEN
jgi:hypothetical protein